MQIEHSEFQDQLVRGLTHRMNNILTLFQGYVGLMLDEGKHDKSTLDGLKKIRDGARAASELMDRTHSLARPSSLVWREVNLADFIRMLKPTFDQLCGPKVRLKLDFPEEDVPPVWADALRIKNAIMEIVRNAIEATAAGGTVKIGLRSVPQPAGAHGSRALCWVELTVHDDGTGIPEKIGEKVFQPFFSTKRQQTSSGLGLTVALSFVQQLGGVLRFTSEPGNTCFELLLPCRAELS
jgi:signal transduction histidine kinase